MNGRPLPLLAAILLWWPAVLAAQPEAPETMLEDATLRDVCLVDPQHGWAVGDRGVIWCTADGGRRWQRQQAPVSCQFDSVHFVNPQVGWIVGGWVHPYSHRTTGVVLRTRDGGQRWLATPGLTLPLLKRVKFVDELRGWALGSSSQMYPSGLFRTEDGGRSWSTVPSGRSESLLTGDFIDLENGAVAGRRGELLAVRGAGVRPSRTADVGGRSLHCLRLSGPRGWLTGDSGLVMRSDDGGHLWQVSGPPPQQAQQFDFFAVAADQQRSWVAGAPGSVVFHSADGGRSWTAQRTGQATPLRALYFVDSQRGWAVGDLGVILATADGGGSWHVQRRGGERAALLGLFSQGEQVPLELLVRCAGDQGYLAAIEAVARRDLETASSQATPLDERLPRAVVACGAASGRLTDKFPVRQQGIELDGRSITQLWSAVHDGDGLAALEAQLVQRIRQWRPDVVLTDGGDSPLARVTSQVVRNAVQRAADPTSYAQQLTMAGLQPWQVKKLFVTTTGDQPGGLQIVHSQLSTRLGESLSQYADRGYGLLRTAAGDRPPSTALRLALSQLPQDVACRSLFHGLNIPPGGGARRTLAAPAVQYDLLTQRAQLRRNLEAFVDQTVAPGGGDVWIGQLGELTKNLSQRGAGATLFELAEAFRRTGRFDLAADTLERLVQQHADHELAEASLLWLIRYYASSEASWQARGQTGFSTLTMAMQAPVIQASRHDERDASDGSASPIPTLLDPQVRQAVRAQGRSTTAAGDSHPDTRWRRALELGELVQRTRPALYADPALRFALAVAQRETGLAKEADQYYRRLAAAPSGDAWWKLARAQLWLQHGTQTPPVSVVHCDRAAVAPLLDGNLDDALWQQAPALSLTSPLHDDSHWPATAMLAYDSQYLYWAASCRKGQPQAPRAQQTSRQRDADLQMHDRVVLLLDLDRDFATFYELTVDHRGWGADRCLDDRSWNPRWHIASQETDQQWTMEAAIPWSELAPQAPQPGDAWAVGVQRVEPHSGLQSWTKPAAVQPQGEGCGLVVFR